MPTVYRSAMQAYIGNCRASNAYSSSAYPREYTTSQYQRPGDMSRRSAIHPYPVDDRDRRRDDDRYYRRSRGDSHPSRRPPPPREHHRREPSPPPRRRRPSTNTSTTPPPRRKSVRFNDGEKPSSRRHSNGTSSLAQPSRPKTFAQDAPPAAISESARDTARRLFHRRPSDGGRPSARPTPHRLDSSRTMETTRAEMGTHVGGRHGEGPRRSERQRERGERERVEERRGGGRSRRW